MFRLNGKLTGFAFVNDWSPSGRPVDWCMSEYFVLRKYRRSGIGTHAARGIIAAYPGVWEIAIASFNAPAQIFWRNILSRLMYEVEELSGDGVSWSGPIFRLTARQRP